GPGRPELLAVSGTAVRPSSGPLSSEQASSSSGASRTTKAKVRMSTPTIPSRGEARMCERCRSTGRTRSGEPGGEEVVERAQVVRLVGERTFDEGTRDFALAVVALQEGAP